MPNQMEGFLNGWKEISAFLGVHSNTAKKWFSLYNLPIHTLPTGHIAALPHELRLWLSPNPDFEKIAQARRKRTRKLRGFQTKAHNTRGHPHTKKKSAPKDAPG